MKTFAESYVSFFRSVFLLIDRNWKLDQRESEKCNTHRIKFINPEFRHLFIIIGMEKGRFIISIMVDRRVSSYVEPHSCSLSVKRTAVCIANDIQRKIIPHCGEMMQLASEHQEYAAEKKENENIVKHCLSRLFPIYDYYDSMLGFKTKNINGAIRNNFTDNYTLKLENLTQEQLIRVSGFISGMDKI
ncbi:hypothetical protein H3J60_004522 [Salmonella enterica]|nr:hypothetical protein [Salmonella enterica]